MFLFSGSTSLCLVIFEIAKRSMLVSKNCIYQFTNRAVLGQMDFFLYEFIALTNATVGSFIGMYAF